MLSHCGEKKVFNVRLKHPAGLLRWAIHGQPAPWTPAFVWMGFPPRADRELEKALKVPVSGLIPEHVVRQQDLRDPEHAPALTRLQPPQSPVGGGGSRLG